MKLLVVLFFCFSTIFLFAQDTEDDVELNFELGEIAVLKVEPTSTDVILNLDAPVNAGEKVKIITANNTKWINFTSALEDDASPRNISIKIDDGSVPSGIYLKLKTASYTGSGKGQLGVAKPLITLNNTSQVIVSDIGAAYTGSGVNNGFELTYYLEIYDYKLLDVNNSETLSISLTLTDY